ncbi:integrase [Micromonospora sp. NPDC047548]|uniref:integrase n=1 Tax=Micromonospora sp. NPDC047548 TaxID=3155624 RepID=UPI003401442A
MTQATRNLIMDVEDAGCRVKYLIRDRDGKYPRPVRRHPRRHRDRDRARLLDRMLIWNQAHLTQALREYEHFHNEHRPHRGQSNARPLHPLPKPITDPEKITQLNIHRRDRLGGVLHEYEHAA